jgi:hypothetical protein
MATAIHVASTQEIALLKHQDYWPALENLLHRPFHGNSPTSFSSIFGGLNYADAPVGFSEQNLS